MTRERPSQTSKRISSTSSQLSGATAALQLLPVAAFMVDGVGALQGCNELFESIAGVPHELLLGREWWQAFAARSADTAARAHDAIVSGGEVRGALTLELVRSDGSPTTLSVHWLRVTEPGTRRPVWILSAFDIALSDDRFGPERAGARSLDWSSLVARELDAVNAALRAPSADVLAIAARLANMSATLRALSSVGPAELPLADVLKRSISTMLHDSTHPVRLKVESNGTLRAHPVDPARVVTLVVEDARSRCANPPVSVRAFECPVGVCFEVQNWGPPIEAELQARVRDPRLFDRDPRESAASALEIAAAMVHSLGGTFSIESSMSAPQIVRFSIPPR